jgi:hypothetical protein
MSENETNNRFPIFIITFENKFKVFDIEGDLLNIWYVNDLSESEAQQLLIQEKAILICFMNPEGNEIGWINKVQTAIITLGSSEKELLTTFINTEFEPRKFKSRNEYYEWARISEESALLKRVLNVYHEKMNSPYCKFLNKQ